MLNAHEYIAYAGEKFIIEWFYDETGKSQSMEYFEQLSDVEQDRTIFLFKRMGDFGRISEIQNSILKVTESIPSNRSRPVSFVFYNRQKDNTH